MGSAAERAVLNTSTGTLGASKNLLAGASEEPDDGIPESHLWRAAVRGERRV